MVEVDTDKKLLDVDVDVDKKLLDVDVDVDAYHHLGDNEGLPRRQLRPAFQASRQIWQWKD